MQKLTGTDTQIIEALRKNARQSNKEMAEKIGVSDETVRRHVQAMVKSGALEFDVNVSAEAVGMPVQALIYVEGDIDPDDNFLEHSQHARVIQTFDTVEGQQVYVIAAADLKNASEAFVDVKAHMGVTRATITFLYPNGDHRI